MSNNTTKSHKSRKTGSRKPRQSAKDSNAAPGRDSSSTAPAAMTPSLDPTLVLDQGNIEAVTENTPTDMVPLDPKTQPWYREPTSKTRKQFDKIMVATAAGKSAEEIAKKLGTTAGNVRFVRYIGRKNGWCDDNDELVDLEAELAFTIDRKIVRNIDRALDGQMTNWQTHEMTMAAAKGRGHFKNHDVIKTEGSNGMQVVAIKVVMPAIGAEDQKPEIGPDQMGGVPAYMDAEVVSEPEQIPAMRAELQWVFDFFKDDEIGIIGSALRDFDSAHDLDVLFPARVDFRALSERLKIPYRGGWDTPRGRIHILSLGQVAQVGKVVQLTQNSSTERLDQHPQAVLLRDGTILNEGVHFVKE